MIPEHLRSKIAKRLTDEIGTCENIGWFLFCFSALESNRDVEYALEELKTSTDDMYKKAIHIVLEEIAENQKREDYSEVYSRVITDPSQRSKGVNMNNEVYEIKEAVEPLRKGSDKNYPMTFACPNLYHKHDPHDWAERGRYYHCEGIL